MRIQFIKFIGSGVKVRFSTGVSRQKDELGERGRYQCLIGCRFDQSEAIEYELKKKPNAMITIVFGERLRRQTK